MRAVLPLVVFSQFLCTSVWFTGNAIASEIIRAHGLEQIFLAHLTSAIQFGFISGTLLFAVFMVSDRFSPCLIFFYSSLLAAVFNLGISFTQLIPAQILMCRFMTGFFLAGIYPVGMKIVSDHFERGLGRSLGFLVGALVMGTALPHLLKDLVVGFPWQVIVYGTSVLCVTCGFVVLSRVKDGPFRRPAQKISSTQFANAFKQSAFRSVSFGYFGHMWELYTFWAFLPVMLSSFNALNPGTDLNVSLM